MTTSRAATIAFLTAAFAALCSPASGQTRPSTAPASAPTTLPFTVDKDTMRLTGPLRPDGRVDYLAALNAQASKGVTKDNNAAIPFIQTIGSDLLPPTTRDQVCEALGIKLDQAAPVLELSLAQEGKYIGLQRTVWQAKDYPDVLIWLNANTKSLGAFTDATRKPRYFVPCLSSEKDPSVYTFEIPHLGKFRAAARMLVMRANLAIAEGRLKDAWEDVQAVYRLTAMMNQDPSFIGRLVAIACSNLADQTAWNIATSGRLDAKTAKAMLAELPSPQTSPTVIDAIDQMERYGMLDAICGIPTSRRFHPDDPEHWPPSPDELNEFEKSMSAMVGSLLTTGTQPASGPEAKWQHWAMLTIGIDWNVILRRANQQYDALLKPLSTSDLQERSRLQKDLEAKRKLTGERVVKLPPANADQATKTQWLGDLLFALLTPTFDRGQVLSEQARVGRQLTAVALALAACKAEKGKYPAKLAELSPGYLKEVPKDFFSGGKDFVYKPAGDGCVLYSVGENGQDDGGKDKAQGGDDLVVRAEK